MLPAPFNSLGGYYQLGRKIISHLLTLLAVGIIFLAIVISIIRTLTPWVNKHNRGITTWISQLIHQPLEVSTLAAGWRGLEPTIILKNITLIDPNSKLALIKMDNFEVGINLWRSIISRRVLADKVFIEGAKLNVYQLTNNEIVVKGLNGLNFIDVKMDESPDIVLLQKFLAVKKILLRNITVMWHGADGKIVPMQNLTLGFKNSKLWHDIWGEAWLMQDIPSHTSWLLHAKSKDPNKFPDKGSLYFEIQNLLTDNLPLEALPLRDSLRINHGNVSGELWVNWSGRKIDRLQTNFSLRNVDIENVATQQNLWLNSINANFFVNRNPDQSLTFTGDGIQINLAEDKQSALAGMGLILPEMAFYAHYGQDTKQIDLIYLKELPISLLRAVTNTVSPPVLKQYPWQEWVDGLDPKGELQDVLFKTTSPNIDNDFLLTSKFKQLQFASWRNIPGVDRLSGSFTLTPTQGKLDINGENNQLDVKNYSSTPIYFQNINAELTLAKEAAAWMIKIPNLTAKNPELFLKGKMGLRIPFNGESPYLSLLLDAKNIEVKTIKRYLPLKNLHLDLNHWIKNSLDKTGTFDTSLLIHGKIADFPFNKQQGTFLSTTTFNNMALKYKPQWPSLSHLNGQVIFQGSSIWVNIFSGSLFDIPLKKLVGYIPTVSKDVKSQLYVTGALDSTLSTGLRFLQSVPIDKKIKNAFEGVKALGPMALGVEIKVALEEPEVPTLVKGILDVNQGKLSMADWGLEVNKIQGQLAFSNDSTSAQKIHAQIFNEPVTINVATLKNAMQIGIEGKIDMSHLQKYTNSPWLDQLTGTTNYQADLLISKDPSLNNTLNFSSQLVGLNLSIPEPFKKLPNQSINFNLNMAFKDQAPIGIKFNYGEIINGAVQLQKKSQGLEFQKGEIIFGKNPAVMPKEKGLKIFGDIDHVDMSSWQPLFAQTANSGNNQKLLRDNLTKIDVTLKQVDLYKMRLGPTHVQLFPKAEYWLMKLGGNAVAGEVQIPYNSRAVDAVLEHLNFTENTDANIKAFDSKFEPTSVPALNLMINNLRVGDKNYGDTQLILAPKPQGVAITRLMTKTANYSISATGDWIKQGSMPEVRLQGNIDSKNLLGALTDWGIPPFILSKKAQIHFDANWPGSLFQPTLSALKGDISLQIHNGRIIDLSRKAEQEIGFGQILTLLSLQSLPRRLTLDFTDLTKAGYSFELLQGTYSLDQGKVVTHDTHFKGIVADMDIQGAVAILQKHLDLTLTIIPHVTSSLPIIATIAGGPIVGAATWVANTLLGSQVDKITARHFQVTGSFDKPQVNPILKMANN